MRDAYNYNKKTTTISRKVVIDMETLESWSAIVTSILDP